MFNNKLLSWNDGDLGGLYVRIRVSFTLFPKNAAFGCVFDLRAFMTFETRQSLSTSKYGVGQPIMQMNIQSQLIRAE